MVPTLLVQMLLALMRLWFTAFVALNESFRACFVICETFAVFPVLPDFRVQQRISSPQLQNVKSEESLPLPLGGRMLWVYVLATGFRVCCLFVVGCWLLFVGLLLVVFRLLVGFVFLVVSC